MTASYPPPLNRPGAPPVGDRSSDYIRKRLLEVERKPDLSADRERRSKYEMRGIRLLCKHYGIPWELDDERKFVLLAFRLAEAHVPYFRQRMPRKTRSWTLERQEQLLKDVDRSRREARGKRPPRYHKPGSVAYACEWLVLNDPRYAGFLASSLQTRHTRAIINPNLKGWESRAKRQETGDDISVGSKVAPDNTTKKIKNIRRTR